MTVETPVICATWDEEATAAYVAGTMDEGHREAFEDHYFECASCLAAVQALQAAARVLAQAPARMPAARLAAAPARLPPWAMAAALAVVALGGALTLRELAGPGAPSPGPSAAPSTAAASPDPRLLALAQADAFPYAPFASRGGGPDAKAFESGMGKYLDRDYAGAAALLRGHVERQPEAVEARFYLGVSELLSGQAAAAEKDLARAAATTDEAVAAPARLYLAKARLAQGDAAGARSVLQALAGARGAQAAEAQRLLDGLRAIDAHD
jgi:hypothetical protein